MSDFSRVTTRLGTFVAALAILCGTGTLRGASSRAPEKAEHVVLIVWDGMRPDFITEANTPTLWKLAREGVMFRNHHSIYPTLTSVNAAALATGVFPSRSGPIGNWEYRPEIRADEVVRMDNADTIRQGDEATGGKYLAVPTIAELVRARGGRTAVAGTKSAPFLFDRKLGSVTLVGGETSLGKERTDLEKVLGPYPRGEELPGVSQDKWTTRALTEVLWKGGVPEFSVLWMGDPDRTEHADAPGSAAALAAIKSVDDNLAVLLKALEAQNARATTDILLVSDHGFSTIARAVDIAGLLQKDGFSLIKFRNPETAQGDVRVIGNGGTVFFYVKDRAPAVTARLVHWLQQSDFAGVIFSRAGIEGTFPLSRVHLETEAGPDVALSMRWNSRRNENGVAGMIDANGSGQAKGTHGTLSRFDVHNVLVAAGPNFRTGLQSDLPSSNLDVAATIMQLLKIDPPQKLDGRVLEEALLGGEKAAAAATRTEEAAARDWRQHLRVSRIGSTEYLDEGNSGSGSQ